MKLALLITYLAFITSCTPTNTVGDVSSGAATKNASAPYIWGSAFPKDLKISTSFDSDETANITAMSTQWETSVNGTNFFEHTSTTAEKSSAGMSLRALGKDNVMGVYKITEWPQTYEDEDKWLPSTALAVTQIFGNRYNIGDADEYVKMTHADILVNYDFYTFRTSTSGSGVYDLQTVLAHEMGHFLGLSHKTKGEDSIMKPTIGPNSQSRAPTSLDVLDVADKYHITLGTGSTHAISGKTFRKYAPKPGDEGEPVTILVELHADGECVHKMNGAVFQRHSSK